MKTEHRAKSGRDRKTESLARNRFQGPTESKADFASARNRGADSVARRFCFRRPVLQHQRFMRRPLRWQRIDFVWLSAGNANANNTVVSSRELQLAQVPDAGRARTKRISLHSDVIPSLRREDVNPRSVNTLRLP